LNDFLEWIRKNPRYAALVLAGLMLFSAGIGTVLGISRRNRESGTEEIEYSELLGIEVKKLEEKFYSTTIPSPVVPSFQEEGLKFSFYLDENPIQVESEDLLKGSISELLKYRNVGVECDIKPFRFKNQEMDVLTRIQELVEP